MSGKGIAMGKGDIRHLRTQAPPDCASDAENRWLSQHTVFLFDLELLLPHQPIADGFERAKLMVENRLHRVVRRRDRVIWTVSGFYLVIGSPHFDQALSVAERVKEHILAHFVQPHAMQQPPSAMAMRLASASELERFSLMSA